MPSRWKIAMWAAGGAAIFAVVIAVFTAWEISRHARQWINLWLTQEFESDAELSGFEISFYPRIHAAGQGLVLHFHGRLDLPPLLVVDRFDVQTTFSKLLRRRPKIQFLRLQGFQLNIPPRDPATHANDNIARAWKTLRSPYFEEVFAQNASLNILTSTPGKRPREFKIEHLDLTSTGADNQLAFRAVLQNPAPPGRIQSSGTFGPWQSDAPSLTPVSGRYTFQNADLSVFRGISGILSSEGEYQGVLERIQVDGTTDTPDFRVTRAGHAIPLSTTFHAVVDGTNGDTYLEPVEAHLLDTVLVCGGNVEGRTGQKGKEIILDVNSKGGRIEDLLQLAVSSYPALSGKVHLHTKFGLAPGPQTIPERLRLQGEFQLESAHFTSGGVQQKIDNLSKRTQGKPAEVVDPSNPVSSDDVASSMAGLFELKNGTLTLSKLGFRVPGADVDLEGTYGLDDEQLDLHGHFRTQAKLSQTTTGFKSLLLKAVDPFLTKNGKGAILPIRISGPVQHPSYGLDLGHRNSAKKD